MRAVLALVCVLGAAAQKTGLTAEQIVEKSIEACGGRAALEKLASTYAKGLMEIGPAKMRASVEMYAKAPNKRLIVTNYEDFGEVRQGFDGRVAWQEDPVRGLAEQTGEALAAVAREATFKAELKWRELFPKAEVLGREKVGGRDAWVVRLTPPTGKPMRQYYDAETFLLLRQLGGPMDMRVDFSDYRDIGGGAKAPFVVKQVIPAGPIVIRFSEIRNNLDIDDAKFAKPARGK